MLFKKGENTSGSLFTKGGRVKLFAKSGQLASAVAPFARSVSPLLGAGLGAYGALAGSRIL